MIPVLFAPNTTTFTTNGVGRLTDAIDCTVTEERNGIYELLLEYPVDGQYFDDLQKSAVILARPADGKQPQPFRIYRIEKPLNGRCTIYAEHISYQLNWIPVMPFTADTCVEALQGLVANAAENCPFAVWTNKSVTASFSIKEPTAFRPMLGGVQGSILDVYGTGEYEFDNYAVKLWLNRGADTGVVIRYGKNLVDLKQDENIENTYTGVCPFWRDEASGDLVTLPEKVIWSANADNYPYKRTKVVDFSERFGTAPTAAQLRAAAQKYIEDNNIGIPKVSLDVEFVALWQMEGVSEGRPVQSLVIPDAEVQQYAYVENGVLHFPHSSVEDGTITGLQGYVEDGTLYADGSTLTGVDGYVEGDTLYLNNGYISVTYEDYKVLERINLCDTVTVQYDKLGVSAKAKVIKTVYDVLRGRYRSIEIGDARTNLSDIITETATEAVGEAVGGQISILQQYVDHQTELITGGLGGYVVINQNASGQPNEILILDQPTIDSAVNLIRLNQNGIGFSNNGYSGPYFSAWTIDGVFNASAIGAGQMDAVYIKANTITGDKIVAGAITADKIAAGAITADKLAAGAITAGNISLFGKMGVYTDAALTTNGGYIGYMSGATPSGTTLGIGLMDPNNKNYFIATTAGVRMTNGSSSNYAEFHISGGVGQFLGVGLLVQGNVQLNYASSAYSGTTHVNNLNIHGNVNSAVTITGAVTAQASLTVAGAITAQAGLSVTGAITATGDITSSGTVYGAYVYGGADGVARLYQTTAGGNISLHRTPGVVGAWLSPTGLQFYDASTNNRVANFYQGGVYLYTSTGDVCGAFFSSGLASAINLFNTSGEYLQLNYSWIKKVNDYIAAHP